MREPTHEPYDDGWTVATTPLPLPYALRQHERTAQRSQDEDIVAGVALALASVVVAGLVLVVVLA